MPTIDRMVNMLGKQIWDGWTVEKIIGEGSFGYVFRISRSFGKSEEKEVDALKVINIYEQDILEGDIPLQYRKMKEEEKEAAKEKTLSEVKAMIRVNDCPNIVQCKNWTFHEWEEDGLCGVDLWIRMELLVDLKRVKERKMKLGKHYTEKEICKIGMDICQGLNACHKEHFMHRDIKLANIFANRSGIYKLGDFGIARILEGSKKASTAGVGSFAYAAPEQMKYEGHDERVDIYSLGIVLYVLGNAFKFPLAEHCEPTKNEIIRRLSGEVLPPPTGVGDSLAAVILKACAYDPQKRYQNAQQLLEALQNIKTEKGKETRKVPPVSKNPAYKKTKPIGTLLYTKNHERTFLGMEVQRDSVKKIVFQGNMDAVPPYAQDVSQQRNESVMAWMKEDIVYICGNQKIKANEDSSYLFYNMTNLIEINFGTVFDTSQVKNMHSMFSYCNALKQLDLQNFDTSQVTDMHSMFSYCNALEYLDLQSFDTSKVTDMHYMFYRCNRLKDVQLRSFDTSQVTDMNNMFGYCNELEHLHVNGFDTSNVVDMHGMFCVCLKLKELNVENFDTSQVTNMNNMFYHCSHLQHLDLQNFKTNQVTDMHSMFAYCSGLKKLNLQSFETNQVVDMSSMFECCSRLEQLDVRNLKLSQNRVFQFEECNSLQIVYISDENVYDKHGRILKGRDINRVWGIDVYVILKQVPSWYRGTIIKN